MTIKEETEEKKIESTTLEVQKDATESEKMIAAGVHFGHKTNKKHPKMDPYIYGVRNGVNIIDLEKTEKKLVEAMDYLEQLISKGGTLLVVGTKVQLVNLSKEFASECEFPYILERWLGGIITNFNVIKKRVDHLKDLENKKAEGELDKYTKKERLEIDREIESLKKKFEGLKPLSKLPDAIFVLDMEKDMMAIKEAKKEGVVVVGIADTNANPEIADYPIPANDDAISSVSYILNRIKERLVACRKSKQSE